MPRGRCDEPLLVFAARHVSQLRLQAPILVLRARAVVPLRDDEAIVRTQPRVERHERRALEVEIDTALGVEAEIAKAVGTRGAVARVDERVDREHRRAVRAADVRANVVIVMNAQFPTRIQRANLVEVRADLVRHPFRIGRSHVDQPRNRRVGDADVIDFGERSLQQSMIHAFP